MEEIIARHRQNLEQLLRQAFSAPPWEGSCLYEAMRLIEHRARIDLLRNNYPQKHRLSFFSYWRERVKLAWRWRKVNRASIKLKYDHLLNSFDSSYRSLSELAARGSYINSFDIKARVEQIEREVFQKLAKEMASSEALSSMFSELLRYRPIM